MPAIIDSLNSRFVFLLASGTACDFVNPARIGGDVGSTLPVKAIDKAFTYKLVYDAIVCDGFD